MKYLLTDFNYSDKLETAYGIFKATKDEYKTLLVCRFNTVNHNVFYGDELYQKSKDYFYYNFDDTLFEVINGEMFITLNNEKLSLGVPENISDLMIIKDFLRKNFNIERFINEFKAASEVYHTLQTELHERFKAGLNFEIEGLNYFELHFSTSGLMIEFFFYNNDYEPWHVDANTALYLLIKYERKIINSIEYTAEMLKHRL